MKHFIFFKKVLILLVLFFFFDFIISIVLINGLNKYYGFGHSPEVLINGSSMAMAGFNRKEIENNTKMKVATYTHEGVSVNDRYAMINHFFQMYPNGLKTVIYEISPVLFSKHKSADNVYTIFYPYMDDETIDSYIQEYASNEEYYINKYIRTKRFDSRLIRLIMMGYMGEYDNLKTNTLDSTALSPLIAQKGNTDILMVESNIEVFEKTMDLINSHNANVVLVMMPMYYVKLQTFSEEGYGLLSQHLINYSSTRENIKFLDLNQDDLILNAGYFSDQLHFNIHGQRKITNIISSELVEN